MAQIDIGVLLTVVDVTHRAITVRQDPAVVKAARQFREDSVRAARSGGQLYQETRSAWTRNA